MTLDGTTAMHLQELLRPAERALETIFAALNDGNRQAERIADTLPTPADLLTFHATLKRIASALEVLAYEAEDAGDTRRAAVARMQNREHEAGR